MSSQPFSIFVEENGFFQVPHIIILINIDILCSLFIWTYKHSCYFFNNLYPLLMLVHPLNMILLKYVM